MGKVVPLKGATLIKSKLQMKKEVLAHQVRLLEIRLMEPIDVVMLTKNSEHTLAECHQSIKSELVKDIKIPEQLHAYEDAYIINWIKKKGYKAVIGDELYCVHLRPPKNWTLRESLTVATLEIKCGLVHSRVLKYIFLYPPLLFYWFLQFVGKNRHFTRTSQKPSKNVLKEWVFQPNRSINVLSKKPKS